MQQTAKATLYGFEMREPDLRRNEERKTYNIKQVWQRTHEILQLALLGHKATDIAKILNVHPQTVSNTLNSDLGRQKLSELRERRDEDAVSVSKEIERLYEKALAVYEGILDNEQATPALRKEVADTILMDIGGHRAPTKIAGQFAHAYITPQEIEAIKARGRAAALSSGKCIELESVNELVEDPIL